MSASPRLHDVVIPVRAKLAALWIAAAICYLYRADLGLYVPGRLEAMLHGHTILGDVTQTRLLAVGILGLVPPLMLVFTLTLPATTVRWLNLAGGTVHAAVMAALLVQGGWLFSMALQVVGVLLALAVMGQAWLWPREGARAPLHIGAPPPSWQPRRNAVLPVTAGVASTRPTPAHGMRAPPAVGSAGRS